MGRSRRTRPALGESLRQNRFKSHILSPTPRSLTLHFVTSTEVAVDRSHSNPSCRGKRHIREWVSCCRAHCQKVGQVVAGILPDSVLFCGVRRPICNGHPASVVVNNQSVAISKKSNLNLADNYEPADPAINELSILDEVFAACRSNPVRLSPQRYVVYG